MSSGTSIFGPPLGKVPAYTHIAEKIRRAIHLGHYGRGERLPSEAELGAQMGFSRVTVREAIRQLEGEGYLEIRRGARGGLFVKRNEYTPEHQVAYLQARWRNIDDLFDYRMGVESTAARLAASRRSTQHLERLEAIMDAFRDATSSPGFRRADSDFHLAIADASANAYLRQAIEDARAAMFLPFDVLAVPARLWSEQPRQHQEIFEAIACGDSRRAEWTMTDHLQASRKHVYEIIWHGERN